MSGSLSPPLRASGWKLPQSRRTAVCARRSWWTARRMLRPTARCSPARWMRCWKTRCSTPRRMAASRCASRRACARSSTQARPSRLPRCRDLWEAVLSGRALRAAGQGDGLGLSIAKTVFDLHGYAYGAENTPAGPRFWFRFGKA